MLFDTLNISTDTITNDILNEKNISLHILRLDKIHSTVSGNKLFKLHYFLLDAIELSLPGLITFGGPYSNHLLATAFACKTLQLKSTGFIRGERPAKLSPTLTECMDNGMQLYFMPRELYNKKDDAAFIKALTNEWKDYVVVPEGGYHTKGAAGAALITSMIDESTTHLCTAVGTATTLAGLLMGVKQNQTVVGVPVLKGMHDIQERVSFLTGRARCFQLLDGYHFGGYAKKTPELIRFMNDLYTLYHLPTDFVYTAKMMFAVLNNIEKGFFADGSKICCLHTGGLQGNVSLPAGTLNF